MRAKRRQEAGKVLQRDIEAGSQVMRAGAVALWTLPGWLQVPVGIGRGKSWEVGWGSGPEGTSRMRGGLVFALWSRSHFQSHLIGLVFQKDLSGALVEDK